MHSLTTHALEVYHELVSELRHRIPPDKYGEGRIDPWLVPLYSHLPPSFLPPFKERDISEVNLRVSEV
jgi:hypothetical protein